jgi:hypothetical protein
VLEHWLTAGRPLHWPALVVVGCTASIASHVCIDFVVGHGWLG